MPEQLEITALKKAFISLTETLEELADTAWKVDLLDWATTSGNFKQIVQQQYEIIQ